MKMSSDLELNLFIEEGSEMCGFGSHVSLVLQSSTGDTVCIVNVAMENK